MRISPFAAVVFLASPALASPPTASPPTQLVGRVADAKHHPVEGVAVQAGSHIAHTNANGVYRIELAPGDYAISFDYGNLHVAGAALVAEGQVAVADAKLDIDLGEVIHVHDKLVKPVGPKQVDNPDILPPYSEAAITSDAWSRAWLFLDIDETGRVTRMKWLKHPGHDLDPIALTTAANTKFTPARDDHDRPTRSFLVHVIEWPSYWFVSTVEGVTTHRSSARNAAADNPFKGTGALPRDPAASLPCRGSGPLNLDRAHPVYKDCTPPPDPKQFKGEPWLDATAFRR